MLWQLIRILTQLGGTVVLARLLSPDVFGLIVMVLAIIGIGEVLRDFGLTSAAVQARTLDKRQKSNLFWINTVIGSALTVIVFLAAPLISTIYGRPELTELAQALSLTFVLNGVSTQFRAELNRNMRFTALNIADTVPLILGLAAAATVAYFTASVWALVVQHLSAAVLGLIFAVAAARWAPGLPSRNANMAPLLRFGGGVFGTQALAYFTKNVDNIAIGLVWGASPLGLYSRAYQLLMAPIVQILAPMTRVALPILSSLQDDKVRLMAYLRRGQLVGSFVAASIYALVIGLAHPVVTLMFGEAWLGLVPIFQALAVGGIFRALNQVGYWAYLALGLSGHQFRFYLVSQPLIILCMLAGLPWGPLGVAIGHSIAYAINWFAALLWCGRITGMDFLPLIRDGLRTTGLIVPPLVLLGLAASNWIGSPFIAIGAGVLAGACWIWLACILFSSLREDANHLLDVIKRSRSK